MCSFAFIGGHLDCEQSLFGQSRLSSGEREFTRARKARVQSERKLRENAGKD